MNAFYATILVLVVTNQRVILGTDSRKTYLSKDGIYKTGTLDKIYQTKDFFYSVCGFHEEETNFSMHQLLHRFLSAKLDVRIAFKQLAQDLAVALKHYFATLKSIDSDVFYQLQKYSARGGEIFIVSRVNSIPTAWLFEYQLSDSYSIDVRIKTWTTDITNFIGSKQCFWRAIGNTGSLPTLISESDWALQPELQIKRVIEEGVKKFPSFVGMPINMLEVTKHGINWIEKSATAPNQVNE